MLPTNKANFQTKLKPVCRGNSYIFLANIVTPGCGIQESQGLQLAQMKFELNNSSQCTIIPNLIPRYNNKKIGLCTSRATCCGSQV